mmetsp:Transcript_27313/g.58435  ORF Transcript_27313/g.58435 Transcript_27313/m.58435 type:complete len:313 (+) Transcript_27313:1801-2739(+)
MLYFILLRLFSVLVEGKRVSFLSPEFHVALGRRNRPEGFYGRIYVLVGPVVLPPRSGCAPDQHDRLGRSLGDGRNDLCLAGQLRLGCLRQGGKTQVDDLVVSPCGTLLYFHVGGLSVERKPSAGRQEILQEERVLDGIYGFPSGVGRHLHKGTVACFLVAALDVIEGSLGEGPRGAVPHENGHFFSVAPVDDDLRAYVPGFLVAGHLAPVPQVDTGFRSALSGLARHAHRPPDVDAPSQELLDVHGILDRRRGPHRLRRGHQEDPHPGGTRRGQGVAARDLGGRSLVGTGVGIASQPRDGVPPDREHREEHR